MQSGDAAELIEDLQWYWGEAYRIIHLAPGIWLAQRRDNNGTLRADTPDSLHYAIITDYIAQPVQR